MVGRWVDGMGHPTTNTGGHANTQPGRDGGYRRLICRSVFAEHVAGRVKERVEVGYGGVVCMLLCQEFCNSLLQYTQTSGAAPRSLTGGLLRDASTFMQEVLSHCPVTTKSMVWQALTQGM